MSWQTGCILICLALIAIWAGAEIVDLAGRRWIKRADSISRGRRHQEAEYLAANTFFTNGDRP